VFAAVVGWLFVNGNLNHHGGRILHNSCQLCAGEKRLNP
jgi:hypothetical protein